MECGGDLCVEIWGYLASKLGINLLVILEQGPVQCKNDTKS